MHLFFCVSESAKEALSKTMVVKQLVKQLKRAENHERVEIIIEVLQMLAEHGMYMCPRVYIVTNAPAWKLTACVMRREFQLAEVGLVGSHVYQDRTGQDGRVCASFIPVKKAGFHRGLAITGIC